MQIASTILLILGECDGDPADIKHLLIASTPTWLPPVAFD